MKALSAFKILFLLNLITEKEQTKKTIIKNFENSDIKITPTLITNYIHKLIESGFDIKTKINDKREKIYFIVREKTNISFSEEELFVISDLKKLLIAQKNHDRIRKTMRLFYKISQFVEDEDTKLKLIDFGYYSTINWNLVRQLEEHCEKKNLILIDYILPQGGNKLIEINADRLKISDWSQRLYLHGILENTKHFLHLPVDRIFMVKKVIKKNNKTNVIHNTFVYTVDKNMYDKMFVDEKESVLRIEEDKITLERPIDDEFYIIQRLLQFCPKIYYVSDERIRNLLKEKLLLIKAMYGGKIDE
ncbi:MAG: hypothetical protein IKU37_00820 [Candidatus Gastranaerophilales bacterium]|nr:hypothetical protein [Candidatus Gastranaerophilales bacterium]